MQARLFAHALLPCGQLRGNQSGQIIIGERHIDARRAGLFALVISGARAWVELGLDVTAQAALQQARAAFEHDVWREAPRVLRTIAERRATFLCKPGLVRPPTRIAPGLAAAGDYIDGPYPATLEGAVRSARAALGALSLGAH